MVWDEQARAWEEKANESETRSALDVPIQSAHSETNVRIISEQMHDTDIKTTLNWTHQSRSEKVRVPRAGVRSGINVTKKH